MTEVPSLAERLKGSSQQVGGQPPIEEPKSLAERLAEQPESPREQPVGGERLGIPTSLDRWRAINPEDERFKMLESLETRQKAVEEEHRKMIAAGTISQQAWLPMEYYDLADEIIQIQHSIDVDLFTKDETERVSSEEAPGFVEGWLQQIAALQRLPQTIAQMEGIDEKLRGMGQASLLALTAHPFSKLFELPAEAIASLASPLGVKLERVSVYDKDMPWAAGTLWLGQSLLDSSGWEDDGSALRAGTSILIDLTVAASFANAVGKASTRGAAKIRATKGALDSGTNVVKRLGELGATEPQKNIAISLKKLSDGHITWDRFRTEAIAALSGVNLGRREMGFWSRVLNHPLYEGIGPAEFKQTFMGTIREGQAAWGIKYNAITDNPLFRLFSYAADKAGWHAPADYIAAHKDTIMLPLFGTRQFQNVARIAQGARLMSKDAEKVVASRLDILRDQNASRAFRDALSMPAREQTPQVAKMSAAFNKAMDGLTLDQFEGIMGPTDAGLFLQWKSMTPVQKWDAIQEAVNRPAGIGKMSRLEAEQAYLQMVEKPGKRLTYWMRGLQFAEDNLRALEKAGADLGEIAVARSEVSRLRNKVESVLNVPGLEEHFQQYPWLRRDMGRPPVQIRQTKTPAPRGTSDALLEHSGITAVRDELGTPLTATSEPIIGAKRASEEFSSIWSPSRIEDFLTENMVRASGQADIAAKWATGVAGLHAAALDPRTYVLQNPRKGLFEILSGAFVRNAGMPPEFVALRTRLEAMGAEATVETLDALQTLQSRYGTLTPEGKAVVKAAQELDLPWLALGKGASPTPDRIRAVHNLARKALDLLEEHSVPISDSTRGALERAARWSIGADATDAALAEMLSKRFDDRAFRNWIDKYQPGRRSTDPFVLESPFLRAEWQKWKNRNLSAEGKVFEAEVPMGAQFQGKPVKKPGSGSWRDGDLLRVDFEGPAGEMQLAAKQVLRDTLRELRQSFDAIGEVRAGIIAQGGKDAEAIVRTMDDMREVLMRKERIIGHSLYPGQFFPEEITQNGIKCMQRVYGKDPRFMSLLAPEGGRELTTAEINRRIQQGHAPYSLLAELEGNKEFLASIRGSRLAPYFSEDPMLRLSARALMLGKAETYAELTKQTLERFGKPIPVKGMTRDNFMNTLSLALAETRDPVVMVSGPGGRYRILETLDAAASIHQKDPFAKVFVVDRRLATTLEDLKLGWGDRVADVMRAVKRTPAINLPFLFQDMFKRWGLVSGGYHARNFAQGVLVNYMLGTTPATIGTILRGMVDPNYMIYTATGPMKFKDILQLFRDQGVSKSMLGAATPTAATEVDLAELKKTIDPSLRRQMLDLIPGANRDIGEMQEFMVRFPAFVQMLRTGESPAYAANKVRHYFFDHSNLTNFEKNAMGAWIPWYPWFRNTIGFGARELFENPGMMIKYMTGVQAGKEGARQALLQTLKPWHQEGGQTYRSPRWSDQNVPYQLFKHLRNGDLGRQGIIWLGFDSDESGESFGDLYYVNTEGQEYMHDFFRTTRAAVSALTPWGEESKHGQTFFLERLGPHVQIPLNMLGVNTRRVGAQLGGPEQRSSYMNLALPQKPTVDPIEFGTRFEHERQAKMAFEANNPVAGYGFMVRDQVQTMIDAANSVGYFGLLLNSPVVRTLPMMRMINELSDEGRDWTATMVRQAGLTPSKINIFVEHRRHISQLQSDLAELKGVPRRETIFRLDRGLEPMLKGLTDEDIAKHPAIQKLTNQLVSEMFEYNALWSEFVGTMKLKVKSRPTPQR